MTNRVFITLLFKEDTADFFFPLVWPEKFYAITFGRDEITAELTCINKNKSLLGSAKL